MTLQTVFYILGIISMTLIITILIAFVVTVFYIKNKVSNIQNIILKKLFRPKDIARSVGNIALKMLTRRR